MYYTVVKGASTMCKISPNDSVSPTSHLPLHSAKKILIVDDMPSSAMLMKKMLVKYDCATALSGQEALQKLSESQPDIILLDVMMPDMDGFEVCTQIRMNAQYHNIPIIMVTALGDRSSKLKGLQVGVNEFLTKPIDATELSIRVSNILKIKEYNDLLVDYNNTLQKKITEVTQALEISYQETIERLTLSVKFKDNETGNHIIRISDYTRHLASVLGYHNVEILALASQMHDIGKIGIPDYILRKKGPLTPDEFDIMKTHTLIGGTLLDNSTSPFLKIAKIIALHHHERFDGSGYPFGLVGDQISMEGLLVAISDQYDALRMSRPYKPALSHLESLTIITKGDGRTHPAHFSPIVLEAFMDSHHIFNDIFENRVDE